MRQNVCLFMLLSVCSFFSLSFAFIFAKSNSSLLVVFVQVNGIDTTVPEWLGHLSMETDIKHLDDLIRLMQDMEPSLKAKAASATRSLY